jgi:hypothetical protein
MSGREPRVRDQTGLALERYAVIPASFDAERSIVETVLLTWLRTRPLTDARCAQIGYDHPKQRSWLLGEGMAKPALLIRLYGSVENARRAYAIDALREALRCAEREPRNGRTSLRPDLLGRRPGRT